MQDNLKSAPIVAAISVEAAETVEVVVPTVVIVPTIQAEVAEEVPTEGATRPPPMVRPTLRKPSRDPICSRATEMVKTAISKITKAVSPHPLMPSTSNAQATIVAALTLTTHTVAEAEVAHTVDAELEALAMVTTTTIAVAATMATDQTTDGRKLKQTTMRQRRSSSSSSTHSNSRSTNVRLTMSERTSEGNSTLTMSLVCAISAISTRK